MRIGYLSRILPTISETFVINEMRALSKRGVTVVPFSVHPPEDGEFQENARDIFEQTQAISVKSDPLFWLAPLLTLLLHPILFFSTLFRYVLAPRLSLGSRFRAKMQFLAACRAQQLFRKTGIDHIHAHFANIAAGIAMMGSRMAGISFSFTGHSYGLFVDNMLLNEKIRDAAFMATVSHFNIDHLQKTYPASKDKPAVLVRCSVDGSLFSPQARKKAPDPVVVGVGRLLELKGFMHLVRACAQLRESHPRLKCYIIGDGPQRRELEELIAELGAEQQVTLTGALMQEEVQQYLNQAWVFALPACQREHADNLPVALMESLAMEIPTISTRLRAIPELIHDHETGLLIDQDSVDQLAEAIDRLITDPELAERLARAGRDLVLREFSAEASAEVLQQQFELHITGKQEN